MSNEICKDAHVTNGALVEPVVQTVSEIYSASVEKHFELAKTDELKQLWELTEDTVCRIIEYEG